MKKLSTFFIIFLLVFAAAASGAAYYYYTQYSITKNKLADPNKSAQEDQKKILESLGKIIDIPAGEQPSIATVLDKDKLKDQPFFAKAENGDKVVIFSKAKKAILYRDSINKVMEVTEIIIDQPAPSDTATPAASRPPKPTETLMMKP